VRNQQLEEVGEDLTDEKRRRSSIWAKYQHDAQVDAMLETALQDKAKLQESMQVRQRGGGVARCEG
jgi:hypothetical protein